MLCQNCQKRPASVHLTHVVNGQSAEMYLCQKCANEKGQINFAMPFNINDFFSSFIGSGKTMPIEGNTPLQTGGTCGKCGMSFEDFQRTGKIGCGDCYSTFGERLKPVLKRLHGSVEHGGKIPPAVSTEIKVSKEVGRLQELLNKAVQNEEYEKAAEIRDKIKALQGK